jgi:hypothetical protein
MIMMSDVIHSKIKIRVKNGMRTPGASAGGPGGKHEQQCRHSNFFEDIDFFKIRRLQKQNSEPPNGQV